ncbi:MAG: hypothetical protein QXF88_00630 [Candidatus Aenigmatarchaeota archaeon]
MVYLFFASRVSAQQSHPLSQLTPIDVNLNMNGFSITNANWVNSTSVNANLICLSSNCQSSWPTNSGWTMSGSALYNETANVGIGTNSPSARLHVSGDAIVSGSISSNQLMINGGYPNALTIDSDGNIITKGNLTYSGYTYIIDILRYNGTGEFPFGIKGGYIYPGTCNINDTCMQTSYYLYTQSGRINANTEFGAAMLYDNNNRVLTSVSAGSGLIASGSAPSITLGLDYNTDLIGWANLTSYPSACPGGQFISAIGDTLTCGTPSVSSSGWTMSGSALYNETANVGIGTSSPTSKLEVVGTVNATNFYDRDNPQYYLDPSATSVVNNFQVSSGTITGDNSESMSIGSVNDIISFTTGGQERVRIGNNAIGIGTNSPSARLEITGEGSNRLSLNVSNVLFVNDTTKTVGINTMPDSNVLRVVYGSASAPFFIMNESLTTSQKTFIAFRYSGTTNLGRISGITIGSKNVFLIEGTASRPIALVAGSASTPHLFIDTTGFVGIGTTSPANALDVVGTINATQAVCIAGDCRTIWPGGTSGNSWIMSGSLLYNDTSGVKVGIGTTSPANALDVVGTINATQAVCIAGDCRTTWPTSNSTSEWVVLGSNLYVNTTNIRVGIGTNSPTSKLEINGTGSNQLSLNVSDVVFVNHTTKTVGINTLPDLNILKLSFVDSNAPVFLMADTLVSTRTYISFRYGTNTNLGRITGLTVGSTPTMMFLGASNRAVALSANSSDTPHLFVDINGSIGIGTSSPARRLHVVDTGITVSNDTQDRGSIYWDSQNERLVIKVS